MLRALEDMAQFPEMNPGPVCRMDRNGTVLLANSAAHRLFDEGSLIGRNWVDLCPGMTADLWQRALTSPTAVFHEAEFDDRCVMFQHVRPAAGDSVFAFGADITNQRMAERALRQSEKMATLGTLVAGVAHELNNPAAATRRAAEQLRDAFAQLEDAHQRLDSVGLNTAAHALLATLEQQARERAAQQNELDAMARADAEAAVEEWLDEHDIELDDAHAAALAGLGLDPAALAAIDASVDEQALGAVIFWAASVFPVHALLNEIHQGASRLSEIVGALKSYSYLGQAPVLNVDLHEGLDNTLVILRSKLKHGITVNREYGSDVPRITAYGSELNQVWTNIIDNAADAMNGSGVITIRTRRDGPWAVVEIEDNGPGIPPENLAHVFDPFFTTKAPGKGTGLGLSTSFSIITEKHKGTIHVESRPGSTRFVVKLPVDAAPASA